ncbi:hypothetical protein DL96DRAFT_1592312 [Flagelloscypha sp. PMI_526]|nr:hypothetical protein DL96DRAFT_1592312 [Flagelloscypha sp. PMI_526]
MSRGRLQARKVAAEIQASWVCFANVTTLEVRPLASRYFQQTRPIPKVCSYMENLFITFGNSLLHLILDFEGGDFNRRDILWANHHTLPQLVHLEVMIGSTGDREMMTCIQRLVSKSTRLETFHFRQAGFHPVLLSAWPLPADGEFHRLHSLSFNTGTRYGGNPTTIDPLVVCLTKFKGQIVHFALPRWFVDGPFSWMKASSLESLELALNKREAFLSLQAHLNSSQVKLRSLNLTFSHSFELRLSDLLGGFSTMSSLNSCTIYANAMNIGILSHFALSFPNLRTLDLSIWSRIDGQQSGASANEGDLLFKKFPYRELVREMQTMTNEPGFKSWALEDIRLELGRSTAWALMVEFARHVPSLVSFSGRGHKHCPSH